MRRALTLVLVVALGALIFAPGALAQDDNPTGDDLGGEDRGGERAFDDNPSGDDLGADDNGGDDAFDDNPTGDDPGASSTSSATATASATATPEASTSPRPDAGVLPRTGGPSLLAVAAGVLLVGGGITATMLLRRNS
jgi:hypothetical protein